MMPPPTLQPLIQFLQADAFRRGRGNRVQFVDRGQSALIEMRLVEALKQDRVAVAAFLKDVFDVDSPSDLVRAEFYALRDWLLKPMLPGEPVVENLFKPEAVEALQAWRTPEVPDVPNE